MERTAATILTPANGLAESKDFYRKLRFREISGSDPVWFTDGRVIIELAPTTSARAGLKLYGRDWSDEADSLHEVTKVVEKDGLITASDPNGVRVYLVSDPPPETGIPEDVSGLIGSFAGLTIEAVDTERTCRFWECLGYEVSKGAIEHGWVQLSNEIDPDISVIAAGMCPHLFFNPGLSFFNGSDNLRIIQDIRDAGVPITEEITVFNEEGIVDNVIIRDPGGLGFFIFSD